MTRAFDAGAKRAYAAYLRRVITDPAVAAALLPDYGPVAKRPTLSNDFLRTFNRANTDLVTAPIHGTASTSARSSPRTACRPTKALPCHGFRTAG